MSATSESLLTANSLLLTRPQTSPMRKLACVTGDLGLKNAQNLHAQLLIYLHPSGHFGKHLTEICSIRSILAVRIAKCGLLRERF